MKIKIRGKGNTPSTGGWSVTDENDVPLQVKRIEMDADNESVSLRLSLFDAHDVDIEGDAEVVCNHSAQFAIIKGDKKIGLCSAHIGAVRYLLSKGVLKSNFEIVELDSCPPTFDCGNQMP